MLAYRVNIHTALSLGGKTYPPGSRVFPQDFEEKVWRRLLSEGILEKKRTQVTVFNLDPEPLKELSLDKLQVMVQNRGRTAPSTAEGCIEILSKDFIGEAYGTAFC